jgi:hypothetical protein
MVGRRPVSYTKEYFDMTNQHEAARRAAIQAGRQQDVPPSMARVSPPSTQPAFAPLGFRDKRLEA